MKIQTGIDIIEVERIQEAIEKGGDHFKNRIYTEQEIAYCESKKKDPEGRRTYFRRTWNYDNENMYTIFSSS